MYSDQTKARVEWNCIKSYIHSVSLSFSISVSLSVFFQFFFQDNIRYLHVFILPSSTQHKLILNIELTIVGTSFHSVISYVCVYVFMRDGMLLREQFLRYKHIAR